MMLDVTESGDVTDRDEGDVRHIGIKCSQGHHDDCQDWECECWCHPDEEEEAA